MNKEYQQAIDCISHSPYEQIFLRPFSADLEELENDVFGFTVLEGHQVACFDSGGEKLICLPQVLEIIRHVSIQTIEETISKLGLVLTECSPMKLDILQRYRILPRGTTYCGLLSQSNAERLCKILNPPDTKTSQSNFRPQARKSIVPSKHQHRIRVMHDCFGQQKGILFPQLYVSVDSKCIECYNCAEVFAPADFVGHTHNNRVNDQEEQSLCHWGFKSSNWRWYLRLADDPSRIDEEESSLKQYLDEIKSRYAYMGDDPLMISCDLDRQTPIDSESLNTSPSLPTPPSLSPPSGINRNLQQSGSIFQQCILKIYNTPLANNEDRHQILNFLVMLRQEHLKQISSLVSERRNMIKTFMKNVLPQQKYKTNEFTKGADNEEESHVQLLESVQQKLVILKQAKCVKRNCHSPESDFTTSKHRKTEKPSPRQTLASELPLTSQDHQSPSRAEVTDCDSSATNPKMTAISSRDQFQEVGSDS